MRVYDEMNNMELKEMRCNRCGTNICVENGIVKEGVFSTEYNWGYFSRKDGEKHIFDLCEKCYEEIVKDFLVKIEIKENMELL